MKFDDQILYAIRQQHKRSLTCYFILISRPWSMEKRIFNLFNCRGRWYQEENHRNFTETDEIISNQQ
jgi:hypothetical protein